MSEALKQAWWAPVAALLVLALVALAVDSGTSSSEDAETRVAGAVLALAGAVVLAVGLWKRPQSRGLGNALIVVGAFLAAFWLWTLILPVMAIVVVTGLVMSEVRSPARAAETP